MRAALRFRIPTATSWPARGKKRAKPAPMTRISEAREESHREAADRAYQIIIILVLVVTLGVSAYSMTAGILISPTNVARPIMPSKLKRLLPTILP